MHDPEAPMLADLRVLDLGALLPAPYCTQILADLGADVIRVEPPAGDPARRMESQLFEQVNRNKRGVVLDLSDPLARGECLRLATSVDVVVEGFRPGVAARLGVGPEAVRGLNERVVYCSISGFGATGPRAQDPGHDLIYLAAAGAMSFPGHWGVPAGRAGVPFADVTAAAYAATAILAAIHARGVTGVGATIDLSITDVALSAASVRGGAALDHDGAGQMHLFPANDLFAAADGVVLAASAVEEHFWKRFRALLTPYAPELAAETFDTDKGRRVHGDALKVLIAEAIAQRPAVEWEEAFAAVDVPLQRVRTLVEAVESPEIAGRGVVVEGWGQRHVPFPARIDGKPGGSFRSPAPALGADTGDVLGALEEVSSRQHNR